ncbi:hypothetical protein SAM9427_23875, partial [Streptomyces sp. ETH9427]
MPKRTIWLAAGVVVLAGTGVTAVSVTGGSGGSGADDASRPAQAHTLSLDGKDPKKRELPRTDTQMFSLVGVSWEDSADDFEGTAQIRTRGAESGTWTDWRDLDFGIRAPETEEGDASRVRGASEPLWVGPSDAVEARVVAGGKETAVPDALRLDMIDPGDEKAGKGQGKGGNGKGNGQGQPSTEPGTGESATATAGATPSGEDTEPTTAPEEPAEPTQEPTEAPATEQPAPSDAPAPSEEPAQEPTATEPDAPAPSEEPTTEPAVPSEEPTAPAPSGTPTQEPTEDPASPAPSEEP